MGTCLDGKGVLPGIGSNVGACRYVRKARGNGGVNEYELLVTHEPSPERDEDLATIQRWLCRITGMPRIASAVDAARKLTRNQVPFTGPTGSERTNARSKNKPRNRGNGSVAPALDDDTADTAERLLAELDSKTSRKGTVPTARENAERNKLRTQILELTGFSTIKGVRAAVRNYLTRRDGKRKYIPTKEYARLSQEKAPPPITIVRGGSPGGGRR